MIGDNDWFRAYWKLARMTKLDSAGVRDPQAEYNARIGIMIALLQAKSI